MSKAGEANVKTDQALIDRLISGGARKPRAPRQPRAVCPSCGKKGLGNTYHAHGLGAYRQCVYCDEAHAVSSRNVG